jgi:hypothetical protein
VKEWLASPNVEMERTRATNPCGICQLEVSHFV